MKLEFVDPATGEGQRELDTGELNYLEAVGSAHPRPQEMLTRNRPKPDH